MGRTVTFAYRVEMQSPTVVHTAAAWRIKDAGQIPGYGKPTDENLAKYMAMMITSMMPGGCNEHIGARFGAGAFPVKAQIVRQSDHTIVATWAKPVVCERCGGPHRWMGFGRDCEDQK